MRITTALTTQLVGDCCRNDAAAAQTAACTLAGTVTIGRKGWRRSAATVANRVSIRIASDARSFLASMLADSLAIYPRSPGSLYDALLYIEVSAVPRLRKKNKKHSGSTCVDREMLYVTYIRRVLLHVRLAYPRCSSSGRKCALRYLSRSGTFCPRRTVCHKRVCPIAT